MILGKVLAMRIASNSCHVPSANCVTVLHPWHHPITPHEGLCHFLKVLLLEEAVMRSKVRFTNLAHVSTALPHYVVSSSFSKLLFPLMYSGVDNAQLLDLE